MSQAMATDRDGPQHRRDDGNGPPNGDDNPSTDPDTHTLFERVKQDPEICRNCFRRWRAVYEINGVWVHTSKHAKPLRESIAEIVTDQRMPGPDSERVPNTLAAHGTRQVCECGYPPGTRNRPLAKDRFFDYADHLYDRLCEHTPDGTDPDHETYLRALYASKTDPAAQFADDRLYADAAQRALHAAQRATED